jgi:hypothetical protein
VVGYSLIGRQIPQTDNRILNDLGRQVAEIRQFLTNKAGRLGSLVASFVNASSISSTCEWPICTFSVAGGSYQAISAYFMAGNVITADPTNNVTINIRTYPSGGLASGTGTLIGKIITNAGGTGSLAINQSVAIPISAPAVTAGGVVTAHFVQNGAGVTIPNGSMVCLLMQAV